jgi:hypothetical protein
MLQKRCPCNHSFLAVSKMLAAAAVRGMAVGDCRTLGLLFLLVLVVVETVL